jgi:hypothetical protein
MALGLLYIGGHCHTLPAICCDTLYRLLPGEEVCLTYGRHTNLELLELYGFVSEDNPHDKVTLPLEHLESVLAACPVLPQFCLPHIPLHQAQAQLQQHLVGPLASRIDGSALNTTTTTKAGGEKQRLPDWLTQDECFLHANGQPSFTLLRALRTSATPPQQRKAAAARLAAGEKVSEQGEQLVRLWLVVAASLQLTLLARADPANSQAAQHSTADTGSQLSECGKVAEAWVATQVSVLSRVAICNWLQHPLT